MTSRQVAVALALAPALGACGCGEPARRLETWTLAYEGTDVRTVHLPEHVDSLLPHRPGRYSLKTRVELPPSWRGRRLTLAIPQLPSIVTLRVAGHELASLGGRPWDRYRSAGPQAFSLTAGDTMGPTLDLELSVLYQWSQAGWVDSVPRLSASEHGDPVFLVVQATNQWGAAAAAALVPLIGLWYLFVYLLDRRRKSFGWFALGSLCAAYYGWFSVGFTQVAFGRFDGPLVALSFAGAMVSVVYFVHVHFGAPRPSRAWPIALGLYALGCVGFRNPFWAPYILPIPVCLFTILAGVTQVATLLRLWRGSCPPSGSWAYLSSWAFIGAFGWTDFAAWLGVGERIGGVHAGCVATVLFIMVLAALLAREYSTLLVRAAERIEMLQKRQLEIEVLNDELRRQIGDRSRQLLAALEASSFAPPSERLLAPGDLVEDRYRVVRLLGSGGMGRVYEVTRLRDGQPLALKMLGTRTSRTALARFVREAEITAQLAHPNVVTIVDLDVTHGGDLYLVMELVPGSTLEAALAEALPLARALDILRQIGRGLEAIHARGIVHRDLKPGNVLLSGDAVKIADFGISRLRQEISITEAHADTLPRVPTDPLTRTGVIMGTPPYMAPELMFGARAATPRSDMWSFGVIAYQLLAGEYPKFDTGARAIEVGKVRPGLPADVAALVDRCLAADPAHRPTAAEVAAALPARGELRLEA